MFTKKNNKIMLCIFLLLLKVYLYLKLNFRSEKLFYYFKAIKIAECLSKVSIHSLKKKL